MNYFTTETTKDEKTTYCDRFSKSKANKIFYYQSILASVSHMNDTNNLDQRAIYITINLSSKSYEQVRKPIYWAVLKALGHETYGNSPQRPGMILCDDVSGSSTFRPNDHNPHLHGLVFLPFELGADPLVTAALITNIKFKVKGVREVTNVDIQQYSINKSLSSVLDYSDKGARRYSERFGPRQLGSAIYPHDMDQDSHRRGMSSKLATKKRYDDLLVRFCAHPSQFFSQQYNDEFSSEFLWLKEARDSLRREIDREYAGIGKPDFTLLQK